MSTRFPLNINRDSGLYNANDIVTPRKQPHESSDDPDERKSRSSLVTCPCFLSLTKFLLCPYFIY